MLALGAASEAWSHDAASQVSGFTYDSMGRLVDDGTRTYTWDLGSRLTQVDEGVLQTTYGYDALGYRVSRTGGAEQRSDVWNHALAIPSVSILRDGPVDLRYYVHAPDGSLLHAVEAGDDSRLFYHFDEARNTVALTDDAGAARATTSPASSAPSRPTGPASSRSTISSSTPTARIRPSLTSCRP